MTRPRYGWYGDDFTGATDTLATLASAGLRATLFMGVPSAEQLEQAGPLDAVGIAGAARAMDPAEMRAELEPVGRFFAGLGVPVLHYKCCSTFDSAPNIGSIGAAVGILRQHMPNAFVPIVGGQPNLGRFCAFSTLFAAAGAGSSEVFRIDRHPTMSHHPVTPMREADLRRHLALQGLSGIATVHASVDMTRLDATLDAQPPAPAVLFDVMSEADLAAMGPVIWRRATTEPLLAVGASSVARALIAAWGKQAGAPASSAVPAADGPVLVLAGSLSPVTRHQVTAATKFQRIAIDARRLIDDEAYPAELVTAITDQLRSGRHVLGYTAADGMPMDTTRAMNVASSTAKLVASVLDLLPLKRVGIAGGDTSSRAVQALELWGLSHVATLAPGVALCRTHARMPGRDGIQLMLKGGQMGPVDLFDHLICK